MAVSVVILIAVHAARVVGDGLTNVALLMDYNPVLLHFSYVLIRSKFHWFNDLKLVFNYISMISVNFERLIFWL